MLAMITCELLSLPLDTSIVVDPLAGAHVANIALPALLLYSFVTPTWLHSLRTHLNMWITRLGKYLKGIYIVVIKLMGRFGARL